MRSLFLAAALFLVLSSHATVRVVTCQNGTSHFLPVTVEAVVGDTIHWEWVSGSHVVGPVLETDIPPMADTWNGWVNSSNHTFDYVVAYPGEYHYVCHPANPHGEDGYLLVAELSTAVQAAALQGSMQPYPVPFTDHLTTGTEGADALSITDVAGRVVLQRAIPGAQRTAILDLAQLPSGPYWISFYRNGLINRSYRILKQ